jgi:glycosyltransferase involved in cell wall biosynthesis
MLRGECIICFAPDLWSDIWRNRHRMLSIFARENRVLYVEPRNRLRGLFRRLRRGDLRWRDFLRPRVEKVLENLWVYHDPLHLPRTGLRGLGRVIERRRTALLRKALDRLGFSRPILWTVRPSARDLVGLFGEKAVLYQIVDDYFSFRREDEAGRGGFEEAERQMASLADLIIVTSQSLLEAKRSVHSNVHLVRNAVDARTLEAGKRPVGEAPPEVAAASRPVLGYIGGVTDKLDLELLERTAERLETKGAGTLLFVGPVRVSGKEHLVRLARLERSPRVLFAGKKEANDVPAYLRAMDVCLIPYEIGPQALAIDPLKLYEYLAFGKPVVAVDIPSVRPFREVVRVAGSRDEFLRLLDEAAREGEDPASGERLVARRREMALENTWEARVEALSGLVEDVLRRKEPGPAART